MLKEVCVCLSVSEGKKNKLPWLDSENIDAQVYFHLINIRPLRLGVTDSQGYSVSLITGKVNLAALAKLVSIVLKSLSI